MLYSRYDDKANDLCFLYSVSPKGDTSSIFKMHTHDLYEILYIFSGKGSFKVEGSEYSVSGGVLLITRVSEAHCAQIDNSTDYERISIHFSEKTFANIDPSCALLKAYNERALGVANFYHASEFSQIDVDSLFRKMTLCADDKDLQRLTILSGLSTVLLAIRENFLTKKPFDDIPGNVESSIVRYVNDHLTENLSLEDIGKEFFMSTSQINRLFKKSTGNTLWKYVIIKRLMLARQKIRLGDHISSVYKECGFNDYSSFYRAYIKHFGTTPQSDKLKQI